MSSNHQSDLYCQYQIFWSPLLLPPFVPKFKAVYIYIGIQNKAQTWLFAPVCHRFFVKAVLYKWILTTVGIKLWIFKCPPVILFFGRSWELKCLWARVASAFKRSVRANWCFFLFCVSVCVDWKSKVAIENPPFIEAFPISAIFKYSPSHEVLLENCFPVPWAIIPNKWGSISP